MCTCVCLCSGVKGRVFDASGVPVQNAVVEVKGRSNMCPFRTDRHGEYYRLLLPGNYTFTVNTHTDPVTSSGTIVVITATCDINFYFFWSLISLIDRCPIPVTRFWQRHLTSRMVLISTLPWNMTSYYDVSPRWLVAPHITPPLPVTTH